MCTIVPGSLTVRVSECDPATGLYSISGEVDVISPPGQYNDVPPTSGYAVFGTTCGGGGSSPFIATGPFPDIAVVTVSYTINNLIANGANGCVLSVEFYDDSFPTNNINPIVVCSAELEFNAAEPCFTEFVYYEFTNCCNSAEVISFNPAEDPFVIITAGTYLYTGPAYEGLLPNTCYTIAEAFTTDSAFFTNLPNVPLNIPANYTEALDCNDTLVCPGCEVNCYRLYSCNGTSLPFNTHTNLSAYVKHYSIITTPINELVGEISKRPDAFRIKAFDDDSQSEELEYKTQILQEYVLNEAKQKIMEKLAEQGVEEIDPEEVQQMTMNEVKDELDSYTSVAEKWANHLLTCQKADFNLKEKSEDAFRDMLISAREYYHIYEDNSKVGYNIEVANPKNTWFLTTPDRKYISDPTGRAQGAYAAGTVQVMELSEIIEAVPDLTKEEIDHLRSSLQDYGLINVRESNLGNPSVAPGIDSVTYDTYDPLVLQTRMLIESEMKENNDGLKDFLGLTSNVSSFGYKYVVVRCYWLSKRKIGKLIYLDELGNEQSVLVDENYKSGTIPTEQSLEWGWVNQWYQGTKIGPDIYHIKPYKLLNYCPIIGINYEIKNTEARSLVDLMKPFQVLYNVCMNQL